MLTAKVEIIFFNQHEKTSNNDGISTKIALRPAFNFGEGLLFSGTIKSDSNIEKYLFKNMYVVKVEFPTIEDEAYEVIESLLKIGMNLDIQNASKKIGEAKLLDYIYKD